MGFHFEKENRYDDTKSRMFHIAIWVAEILFVIALAFVITNFGLQKIKVYGDSMSSTLVADDSILVNKMIYHFVEPKRNDVVVFRQNGQEHSYFNVKRIIGLPGDTIEIKEGLVYVNGELFEEKVETEPIINSGVAGAAYTLEDNEYFVLGDNRNSSIDSRFSSFGTLVKEDIIGKAWIRTNKFAFISAINRKQKVEQTPTPTTAVSTAPTK